MSGWSLSRLCKPLAGFSIPKIFIGSGLAFLGSHALDRLVILEHTRTWKIFHLSLGGLSFLQADHPLTLAAIAVPTALVLRERLLASGGMSLLLGISLVATWASDELNYQKRRVLAQDENETLPERNKDWPMNIAASIHQLACSYLVPRTDWIWSAVMKFLGIRKSRWLYAICAFVGIGLWSLSGYLMPWLKGFYPRIYIRLVHYLQERPLCFVYSVRRIVRNHFDRSLFNVAFGKSPLYRYRPLERTKSEIRLFRLQAANTWDVVKADLISVPISEAPPFEAISYRWASGNEVPILLNKQRLIVSGEVHELLRTLRFQLTDRLLWLDSICIDQKSIEEKEWQIGFMNQIYRSAKQVIGWIAVMRELPFLPSPFRCLTELGTLNELPDEFFQSFLHGNLSIKLRASIISLCNEFFFRTWIIQEVALAQKLIIKFGPEEIMWKDFVGAVKEFVLFHAIHGSTANFGAIIHNRMAEAVENIRIIDEFKSAREKAEELRSAHENAPDGLPISELILGSIDFEATDPRDKVFGLLGLSTDKARRAVPIQYGTDTTDITVWVNAVSFTLINEFSFRLLELGGVGYLSCDVMEKVDGPSWVPRWNLVQTSYMKTLALTCNKLYKTATWAPVVVSNETYTSSMLHMQGIYIDEIQLLSNVWWPLDHIVKANYETIEQVHHLYSGLLDAVGDAFRMVQHAHHAIYDHVDRRSLVWRTICHDSRKELNSENQSFDEDGIQVEEAVRDVQQQLQVLLERGVQATNAFEGLGLTSRLHALMHLFPMHGTRLCITESGYFGVVPPYAKKGDQIWAFSGAPNPFVLRKSSNTANLVATRTHQLVGVCYIDGIMHGELEGAALEHTMVNLV